MSIVLIGIEIPKEPTPITLYPDGSWNDYTDGASGEFAPLPEKHGRLIDADEISGSLAESATFNYNKRTSVCWSDAFLSMIDMLDEAPTIVPAEGGTDNG